MSWWDETPSLTPVAAWDALRFTGTQLTDAVGVNHITRSSITVAADFQAVNVPGNGNRMLLTTPVPMPTSGVVMAYWKIARRNVLLQGNTTSYGYIFHQNESSFEWHSYSDTAGVAQGYGYDTTHRIGVNFAAVVNNGATSSFYLNGNYFGSAIPVSKLPSSINHIGYLGSSEYNLDADEGLSALGVFTGVPTLAELQAIEANVRTTLAGVPASYRGLPAAGGNLDNSPPEARTPFGPGGKGRGAPPARYTAYFGGPGIVTGTVKEKNQPANLPLRRKVQLIDATTSILVRETWSDAVTGVYVFDGVALNVPYTVISYDHTGLYRAVIADNQTAELP